MTRPGGSFVVYADGSSVPGSSGAGVVVLDAIGRIVHLKSHPLPEMTNNEAEYAALKLDSRPPSSLARMWSRCGWTARWSSGR